MDVVFLGMNEAGQKVLEWLKDQEDVQIEAEITEKEQLKRIKQIKPEIAISAGFEHKVPEEIIEVPEKGIVNLHPSYLPFNRGSHPYIWPIVEKTVAGVSIHYMVPEIDEGPVIAKEKIDIRPDDTAKTLRDRLMNAQFEQFKEFWPRIKEGIRAEKQQLEEGNVHYSKELEELSEIDLNERMKAGELIDRLRGLSFDGENTAYFEKDGQRYYLDLNIHKAD
ncbi:formyltransferase family protein [Candidatus Nanohalococcus occultus]|uniref:Methionyl-tRNA formyltransferase n=1 Tax=Candidatus Nanohalococcus occultus TaxID=2978047 RepID=A0ABY8CKA9_9ARCH|nr:Methionyl-tRNA formyltransferase [Candidatus Nanohaloarchaeota archaeon SVXNc]